MVLGVLHEWAECSTGSAAESTAVRADRLCGFGEEHAAGDAADEPRRDRAAAQGARQTTCSMQRTTDTVQITDNMQRTTDRTQQTRERATHDAQHAAPDPTRRSLLSSTLGPCRGCPTGHAGPVPVLAVCRRWGSTTCCTSTSCRRRPSSRWPQRSSSCAPQHATRPDATRPDATLSTLKLGLQHSPVPIQYHHVPRSTL